MTAVLQIIIDGLSAGSLYVLLALGLSLVFSIMGLINFAYGSLIVWAGYAIFVLNELGSPYPLTLLGMCLFVVLLSVLLGRLAFQPFIGAPSATLLLTSFGLTLISQATCVMLFGEQPRAVPSMEVLINSINLGGVRVSVLQITAIGLSILVLLGIHLLMSKTRYGIEIRAAAEDGNTARLVGVRPGRVLTLVFAVSGFIAAIVAFAWFAQAGTVTPRSDFGPTLKAFVAVVLGGLGTVRGAVIGGLTLGLMEATLESTLDPALLSYQQSFAFLLVILVLLMRPQGIAGRLLTISR
jgi:branched-chain amino acid transport system permease protein